ncbi:M1 family aminopeptidase [Pedobacter rhodius]|uniref:M1 family aminopeptidase n=1 Tax=Pedobacter rhodius TaxID=3004098 RepID=A0ABT4KU07_9SPHI|nr:M1 family aminopeptidase [Pedobacter sp. SJ11]MCZ4222428.1 M1 family aminopeptidase [Pedobacter sp. SJ11]
MMRKIFTLLLFVSTFCTLKAQSPHLSGKVEVVMATGQITCDFVLSNIPDLGNDYQVLLNKGFNIKAIKDSSNKTLSYSGFYNGKMRGEGLVYVPEKGDTVLVNPKRLHITYTGAFPIYTDTLNFIDFKGLIAFNGKTMRAADQSKWYPIIYDVKNDRLIEQMTYDIQVTSKDSKTIFVNGDLPKPGPVGTFKSDIAIAPMLFIGDYAVQQAKGALFLNTKLNNKQLHVFEDNIAEMKAYYFKALNIPYDTKNVFIEHDAVEKYNKGRSWAFVAFPTIAFAGTKFGDMIDEEHAKLKDSTDYPYIAHEIAHYYFGNVLQPNATLFWFFLESTAEYLSVKATEEKFGKQFATTYFQNKGKQLKNFNAVPLNTIKDMNSMSGTYRYSYGPFLLRGLEQMIGEKRVFKFLNTCLKTKNELTDYDFFKRNALKSGITQKEWDAYEKSFIMSENAVSLIK